MRAIAGEVSQLRLIGIRRPTLAIVVLIAAVTLGPADAIAAGAEATECPVKTNTAKPGAPLKNPISLVPAQQSAQKLVNFGTSRRFKVVKHITVTANKPLPQSLASDQINFEGVLNRTGNTLETAEFPDPTFSPAYISVNRRSISFAVCLNPAGIAAGKYVGSITVSGPEGLGSATIGLTVNAKDKQLFTVGGLIAILAAFALLVLKDAAPVKNSDNYWQDAFLVPLTNPLWWAATVVALGSAFTALETIYSNDPAWGASGFASLASLVGTATAAVGGHTILTALGTKNNSG
jgi:hypothetical protein